MGGLLHLVQRGGAWAGAQPAQSLLAVPTVTAHPSTASVPITILLYNGPLLCGFYVPINGIFIGVAVENWRGKRQIVVLWLWRAPIIGVWELCTNYWGIHGSLAPYRPPWTPVQ